MPKKGKVENVGASATRTTPMGWESLPWKKVQLSSNSNRPTQSKIIQLRRDERFVQSEGTEGETTEEEILHSDDFLHALNHYDNPDADPNELFEPASTRAGGRSKKLNKRNRNDEYIEGADDPGILLGLQVIDGSQYTVEKVPMSGGGYVSRLIWNSNQIENNVVIKEKKDISHNCSIQGRVDDSDYERTKRQSVTHTSKYQTGDLIEQKNDMIKLKDNTESSETPITKSMKRKIRNDKDQKSVTVNIGDRLLIEETQNQDKSIQHNSSQASTVKLSDSYDETLDLTMDEIDAIQTSWAMDAGGVYLHSHLCKSLARLGFSYPTPIQASTLAAAILGQRDIVGAAPTGSGKTLAYLLPILQFLLEEFDKSLVQEDKDDTATIDFTRSNLEQNHLLTALIMCPTRELALQVSQEFNKLAHKKVECGTIVGGMSELKQKRILDTKRPPVIIGTPGRLWSLMSSKDHQHLNNLLGLRFLVIDEVDRMISRGNYPQLRSILDTLNQVYPAYTGKEKNSAQSDRIESSDDGRLKALQGVPGESIVTMLSDDILRRIELQKNETVPDIDFSADDSEGADDYNGSGSAGVENHDSDTEIECVHRQTFIFSATLTLPPSSSHQAIKPISAGVMGGKKEAVSVQSTISEFLETTGARGLVKFVDLSSDNPSKSKTTVFKAVQSKSKAATSHIQLPPGLSLYEISCTQKHKDSHLYAFLTTTKQGSMGPCLVFCNSIAAVKRVSQTLRILGLPVRTIHAYMQQKARLQAIETLRGNRSRMILVATDVAARGIDLPSVSTVVHYDVAREVDTFVHRSGRTARGIGSEAFGASVSLVSAHEEREHKRICETINRTGKKRFDLMHIDGRLLSAAQQRMSLASKIVECEQTELRSKNNSNWFIAAAADADLDIDDDLLDAGMSDGSRKGQQRMKEAEHARLQLTHLLKMPMRKQNFGKFLSGAGITDAIDAQANVTPFIVNSTKTNKRMKR